MKNTLLKLLTWFGGVSKTVAEFILPLLARGVATALEQLLPVALGIASELATRDDLTGTQKRDIAAERIKIAAMKTGLNVSTNTLELAMKMAVEKLREGGK